MDSTKKTFKLLHIFSFCSVCTLHVVKIALYYIFQQTYSSVWNIFQYGVCETNINSSSVISFAAIDLYLKDMIFKLSSVWYAEVWKNYLQNICTTN